MQLASCQPSSLYKVQVASRFLESVCPCFTSWSERWRNCLRHCTTRQEVAGSIPGGFLGSIKVT
jgi:hypothetical protein